MSSSLFIYSRIVFFLSISNLNIFLGSCFLFSKYFIFVIGNFLHNSFTSSSSSYIKLLLFKRYPLLSNSSPIDSLVFDTRQILFFLLSFFIFSRNDVSILTMLFLKFMISSSDTLYTGIFAMFFIFFIFPFLI